MRIQSNPADAGAIEPTQAEREQMIAIAAYFLAEQRGFAPGGDAEDWYRAERQIDSMLDTMRRRGVSRQAFERAGMRNALRLWADNSD
jgi:microsomal dipeptidase-like Zn-dependent dipeptidase